MPSTPSVDAARHVLTAGEIAGEMATAAGPPLPAPPSRTSSGQWRAPKWYADAARGHSSVPGAPAGGASGGATHPPNRVSGVGGDHGSAGGSQKPAWWDHLTPSVPRHGPKPPRHPASIDASNDGVTDEMLIRSSMSRTRTPSPLHSPWPRRVDAHALASALPLATHVAHPIGPILWCHVAATPSSPHIPMVARGTPSSPHTALGDTRGRPSSHPQPLAPHVAGTGYLGVSLREEINPSKPFVASITLDGRYHQIGVFSTARRAAAAFLRAVEQRAAGMLADGMVDGDVDHADALYARVQAVVEEETRAEAEMEMEIEATGGSALATVASGMRLHLSKHSACGYRGVCFDKGRFKAEYSYHGKKMILGRFDTAVRVHLPRSPHHHPFHHSLSLTFRLPPSAFHLPATTPSIALSLTFGLPPTFQVEGAIAFAKHVQSVTEMSEIPSTHLEDVDDEGEEGGVISEAAAGTPYPLSKRSGGGCMPRGVSTTSSAMLASIAEPIHTNPDQAPELSPPRPAWIRKSAPMMRRDGSLQADPAAANERDLSVDDGGPAHSPPPPPAKWLWPREGDTIEVDVEDMGWVSARVTAVLVDSWFMAEIAHGEDSWSGASCHVRRCRFMAASCRRHPGVSILLWLVPSLCCLPSLPPSLHPPTSGSSRPCLHPPTSRSSHPCYLPSFTICAHPALAASRPRSADWFTWQEEGVDWRRNPSSSAKPSQSTARDAEDEGVVGSEAAAAAPLSKVRRRMARCGECDACVRTEDCGKCVNCLDKPKYGGPFIRKQKCMRKRCKKAMTAHVDEREQRELELAIQASLAEGEGGRREKKPRAADATCTYQQTAHAEEDLEDDLQAVDEDGLDDDGMDGRMDFACASSLPDSGRGAGAAGGAGEETSSLTSTHAAKRLLRDDQILNQALTAPSLGGLRAPLHASSTFAVDASRSLSLPRRPPPPPPSLASESGGGRPSSPTSNLTLQLTQVVHEYNPPDYPLALATATKESGDAGHVSLRPSLHRHSLDGSTQPTSAHDHEMRLHACLLVQTDDTHWSTLETRPARELAQMWHPSYRNRLFTYIVDEHGTPSGVAGCKVVMRAADPESLPEGKTPGTWTHIEGKAVALMVHPWTISSGGYKFHAHYEWNTLGGREFRILVYAEDSARFPEAICVTPPFRIMSRSTLGNNKGRLIDDQVQLQCTRLRYGPMRPPKPPPTSRSARPILSARAEGSVKGSAAARAEANVHLPCVDMDAELTFTIHEATLGIAMRDEGEGTGARSPHIAPSILTPSHSLSPLL